MNLPGDLVSKRDSGRVRLCFTSYHGQPLAEVMARFGLGNEEVPDLELREVSRDEARNILAFLFRFDMAYQHELMSQNDAETLAVKFLELFPSDGARFLTNHDKADNPSRALGSSSTPLTLSTFDAGIICLARPVAGCFWVEDED